MDADIELQIASEGERAENRIISQRELVVFVSYQAVNSSSDVAFSVGKLSKFVTCYRKLHWKQAKQILRYPFSMKDYCITYEDNERIITAYTDVDWAGEKTKRRSIRDLHLNWNRDRFHGSRCNNQVWQHRASKENPSHKH